MAELKDIQEFLGKKRLAVVGVSTNPRDFTRTLFREFRDRGYDAVPVNPKLESADGVPACSRVQDIAPPPEIALLMTQPEVTRQVVADCAKAGIRQVWMYRAGGTGAVDATAVVFCELNGIRVIKGECPFMFFPKAGWAHRAHGFCRKVLGSYPR